jgi:hypothetical protein
MSVILPPSCRFIMAALGFALAKTGRAMDGGTTAFLVATVGTPALVFRISRRRRSIRRWSELWRRRRRSPFPSISASAR